MSKAVKPLSVHSIRWKRNHYCAHIWNDVYRFNTYLYWPITLDEQEKVLIDWFGEDHGFRRNSNAAASVISAPHEEAGQIHLIFFREWTGSTVDWSYLAHEAVHLANARMETIGNALSLDYDEPHAYLVGWLVANAGGAMQAQMSSVAASHGIYSPMLEAAKVYEREPCARTFQEDLELHLLVGYVLSTPQLFIMGRPVDKDAPPQDIISPHIPFRPEVCNCWHIYLASGDMRQFWDFYPIRFPWVSWEKRNRLRFYPMEAIRNALDPHSARI